MPGFSRLGVRRGGWEQGILVAQAPGFSCRVEGGSRGLWEPIHLGSLGGGGRQQGILGAWTPGFFGKGGWGRRARSLILTPPDVLVPQVQTVLERVHIYNYVPIVVGSSIGGLLLLALITAALYKVRAGGGAMPVGLSYHGGAMLEAGVILGVRRGDRAWWRLEHN